MRHILILGGTTEARQLAAQLAERRDLGVTLSLAGRTAAPAVQPVPVRIGGFGGAEGLAAYLAAERIDLLVDATHPYAALMSAHAADAAKRADVALFALRRPPWPAMAGDRWTGVASIADAVRALGPLPRRVFLAIGRKEVSAFAAAPQHDFLIRSVDPIVPPPVLPKARYVVARGPFAETDEHALMVENRTEVVVAKNSGGGATYGKIAAARTLGLEVVMLQRPALPDVPAADTVHDVMAWINHVLMSAADRGV